MVQDLSIAGALLLSGWCLFVRRGTWRCQIDRALTLSVAFIALVLLLTSPDLTRYDNELLMEYVGIRHFDDYLGHMCYFSALCTIAYAILSHVVPDRHRRRLTLRRIEYPVATAALLMLLVVTLSPHLTEPTDQVYDNFFDVPCGIYLHTYWAIYTATLLYLMGYMIRLLWVLRRDLRSRRTANLYLLAAAMGILGVITEFADTWLHFMDGMLWLLLTAPAMTASIAAALSWRRQLQESNDDHRFPTPPSGRPSVQGPSVPQ